jgi:hypothetical protein
MESAAVHGEDVLSLDFVAGADAARAIDAFREVARHVGMREILLTVEVVGSFRVAYFADADAGGDRLEFAVAIHFAGEAVEWMVRENEFDDVAAEAGDLL